MYFNLRLTLQIKNKYLHPCTSTVQVRKKENQHLIGYIFFNMHPLQRILLGLFLSFVGFYLLPRKEMNSILIVMTLWIIFASTFMITSWIVLVKRSVNDIREIAKTDDGSKLFVFLMILLSSFSSMFAVLLLMASKQENNYSNGIFLFVTIFGMLLSWAMVHTIFTFHYAHMFYDDSVESDEKVAGGLEFPKEDKPDYIDFAYFSFVIGCTFQVSDVEVSSRNIRRLVFLHGLISFVLNTFVVALTINLVAGLNRLN